MVLVLALAPLLLGFTRKVKARLLRRRGPPLLQPYRDLLRLIRKEVVLADNASWLFRSGPYMVFATTWVAAALVPTFATGLHVQLGGRPDRHHGADRLGAVLPGAARHGRRHQLRRHRLQPRDDVRLAGRAGHDHDRLHAGAAGGLHPALGHRAVHADARQPARVAGAGAGRARHRGAGGECAHPRRQPGDAPGADHGARGDGARVFRPAPRRASSSRPPSSCCSTCR